MESLFFKLFWSYCRYTKELQVHKGLVLNLKVLQGLCIKSYQPNNDTYRAYMHNTT